jgi:hypothetical protein
MQKTATQKLIDYIQENYHLTEEIRLEFKRALEDEIEQLKSAYNQGYRDGADEKDSVTNNRDVSEFDDAENYVKFTYI